MRILKLRWIGMENEAEKMETAALHRSRKHAGVQLGRYRLTRGSMAHAAAATRRVEQISKAAHLR